MTPTIFGDWSLLREWGRIGSPGTVQARTFEREDEARRTERQGIRKRERHGYRPTPDLTARWPEFMAGGSIQASPKPKSRRRRGAENSGQRTFDFCNCSRGWQIGRPQCKVLLGRSARNPISRAQARLSANPVSNCRFLNLDPLGCE
ncbi:MAG: WGR domain-containing protein [Bryobacterales bacterium]|nr:WGR domain-containing protein [Bryobacterales bacterium]